MAVDTEKLIAKYKDQGSNVDTDTLVKKYLNQFSTVESDTPKDPDIQEDKPTHRIFPNWMQAGL